MSIQRWAKRIWLARFSDGADLGEELRALLQCGLRQDQTPDIVLDLGDVSNLSQRSVKLLLRLRRTWRQRGARLRLTGVSDGLWADLLAAGLDRLFRFMPNVPTALVALRLERAQTLHRRFTGPSRRSGTG